MSGTRVAWIAACLALALATILRVLGLDDRSTAYLLGSATGSVVAAVLVALLLRFLYVRLVRRDRPVWSPWTLVIAAVVSLIVAVGRAGSEAEEREEGRRACANGARTADAVIGTLPARWESAPAAQEAIASFQRDMPRDEVRRLTVRAITRGAQPVGLVMVAELFEPGSADALFAGFASEARGPIEDARVGEASGKLQRTPDGGASLVGLSERCAAVVVLGISPQVTRQIGSGLSVEPP